MYAAYDYTIHKTINIALLSCKKLAKLFIKYILIMNPYNPCVQNLIVIKKQLTILFHIDNLMIAHLLIQIVTEYFKLLDRVYRDQDLLRVTRGVYKYLGVTINFFIEKRSSFQLV